MNTKECPKCLTCGGETFEIWNSIDKTTRGWVCWTCWDDAKGEKGWIRNPEAHHENMRKYGFKPGEL